MKPKRLREVTDLLSILEDEAGEARAWAEQIFGMPCFDVGPWREDQENLLPAIEQHWSSLFNLVTPAELFVWPKFAMLHVAKDGEDVIARAVFFDKRRIFFYPRQARFKREPQEMRLEYRPLGGEDSKCEEDEIGWLPDLYMRALDALSAKVKDSTSTATTIRDDAMPKLTAAQISTAQLAAALGKKERAVQRLCEKLGIRPIGRVRPGGNVYQRGQFPNDVQVRIQDYMIERQITSASSIIHIGAPLDPGTGTRDRACALATESDRHADGNTDRSGDRARGAIHRSAIFHGPGTDAVCTRGYVPDLDAGISAAGLGADHDARQHLQDHAARARAVEGTAAVAVGEQHRPIARETEGIAAPALSDYAQWQIAVGTARLVFVDEIERLAGPGDKLRVAKAIEHQARTHQLRADLAELMPIANARSGRKSGKTSRTLSFSRLLAWCKMVEGKVTPAERVRALAPKGRGRKWTLDADVAAALAIYRQPNKPSISWSVHQALESFSGVTHGSLYARCRRALRKFPKQTFYVGRNSGAALRALQPFRRRDFLQLLPNDVWIGDGHSAKLKIAHPDTGQPFVPEVTLMMDVSDRYIVGWSVALSENCLAVSDALRHGVSHHGIPLIYYSDNGGGQKNKMLDAPVTGIASALGFEHKTGRAENPQGRGVIERVWPTVLIPLAKRFATYRGRGADRNTLRAVSQEIDQQLREAKRADVVVLPRKLPTWRQFLDALAAEIETYNTTHHHRSLPKLDGVNHATPVEYRAHRLATTGVEIHIPPEADLAALFMPSVMRKCQRGEVRLFNGIYFHKDLMLIDGRYAPVGYDIHDCSRVWVKHPDGGALIAVAKLDGNRGDYFPKPFVERLREERAGRRRALLETKLDEVQAELDSATRIEAASEPASPVQADNVVLLPVAKGSPLPTPPVAPLTDERGCPNHDDFAMMDWLEAHRDQMNDEDWKYFSWRCEKTETIDREFRRRFMPPDPGAEEEARP